MNGIKWRFSCVMLAVFACYPCFAANAQQIEGTVFGPTGIIGSLNGNAIAVASTQQGSPADGKLKKGDVITGIGNRKFSNTPNRDIAAAVDAAEGSAANGKMTLMLKNGAAVDINLAPLGDYSPTAPYNCPKTDKIIRMTADQLMNQEPGRLAIEILALMATGEQKYIDAAATHIRNADWAKLDGNPLGSQLYCTWRWGYYLITLSEYYLLTKDASVLPSIRSYAMTFAKGQDARGLYGHRLADPANHMRIPGYGAMNQPTLTIFMGMILAKKCGIQDPALDKAIVTTYKHVQQHTWKGAFPYGTGGAYSAGWNNNGTSGSAAISLELLGISSGTRFFASGCATTYDDLEKGHASTYFNPLWTTLGASRLGPEVTSEHFRRVLWFYNMRRNFDGTWSGDEKPGSMDAVALLNYCLGRKALLVTGRAMDESIFAKQNEVMDIINLSNFDFKSKRAEELVTLATTHPMPQIRRGAGGNLGAHREKMTPTYEQWLRSGTPEQKLLAIGQYGWWIKPEQKLPMLPAIAAILTNPQESEEVRKEAAGSIAHMGAPAKTYYMDILKLVDETEDLSMGKSLSELSANPLKEGLVTDKEMLYRVALKLAGDREQVSRGQGINMLMGMPIEDFHLVVGRIIEVIEGKDPDWTSYHNPQHDFAPAIELLASFNIKEGLDYAINIEQLRPKAKHSFRMLAQWKCFSAYGGNAKAALADAKANSRQPLDSGRHARQARAMMQDVETGKTPPLISLDEAKAKGRQAQ
jgi:hypothetical protein